MSVFACSTIHNNDSTSKVSVKQLAQKDLDKVLEQDSVILIDVRTPEEVKEGFIPQTDSFINFRSADFNSQVLNLDTNYTYVIYCRSGGRSGQASEYMIQNGFTKVYNLVGGILQYQGTLKKL